MTPLWLALLEDDPGDGEISIKIGSDADPSDGFLTLWRTPDRPHDRALQADPRVHDPAGPACVLSLAMAPAEARPIADDPAVVHARRMVLRDGRPRAVTMLSADPVSVGGALTVARADRPDEVTALDDDPFAALWTSRRLHIPSGVFGADVRPTGPCLERYAGRPWPFDRF